MQNQYPIELSVSPAAVSIWQQAHGDDQVWHTTVTFEVAPYQGTTSIGSTEVVFKTATRTEGLDAVSGLLMQLWRRGIGQYVDPYTYIRKNHTQRESWSGHHIFDVVETTGVLKVDADLTAEEADHIAETWAESYGDGHPVHDAGVVG